MVDAASVDDKVARLGSQLTADAQLNRDYLALLAVATLVASLGLEQNSVATIIGAMVVAPLMLPIRALGYALLRMDRQLLVLSVRSLVSSIAIILALGALVGQVAQRPEFGTEILSRTSVTFLGLYVAVAGGILLALSRTLINSKITDSLVGVGIAVSLVPPLCAAGITLSYGAWYESLGAVTLFLTNLLGIALACAIVFWVSGYAPKQRWRMLVGATVFVTAIILLSPVLAKAGHRARQLSNAEAFLATHATQYTPSIGSIESTSISWKSEPYEIVVFVRAQHPPTSSEARRLNDALNRQMSGNYHLTLVVDPTVRIVP